MARILIVEDEIPVLTGLKDNLEMEGYDVMTAADGEQALKLIQERRPDLIVLDIMLPGIDGFEICRQLKEQKSPVAIVILSARSGESDKVYGLELGADDYVTKPFSVLELLARVRAVLRRRGVSHSAVKKHSFGDVEIDFEIYEATKAGKRIEMTPKEFEIMRFLIENRNRVVSRTEILNNVWGYNVFPSTRTIDNHIVKLRKHIEDDSTKPNWIISVRTIGYKFNG